MKQREYVAATTEVDAFRKISWPLGTRLQVRGIRVFPVGSSTWQVEYDLEIESESDKVDESE